MSERKFVYVIMWSTGEDEGVHAVSTDRDVIEKLMCECDKEASQWGGGPDYLLERHEMDKHSSQVALEDE
jgi:hypothetical protein